MVKLGAPLFSFAASGSLANAITYSNISGKPYLKKKSNTPNPRTDAQNSTRAMFSWLSGAWTDLSQAERDSWLGLAENNNNSAFNAYMAFNTRRWKNFLGPSKTPNATATGTPSDRYMTWGKYLTTYFHLGSRYNNRNDAWGTLLHMGDPPTYTSGRNTVIHILNEPVPPFYWYDFPWPINEPKRFCTQPFSDDGNLGPVVGCKTTPFS